MTEPPADPGEVDGAVEALGLSGEPSGDADAEPQPSRIRPFLDAPAVAEVAKSDDSGSECGLRPFVLTSGRVSASDPEIGIETQVSTRTRARSYRCRVCRRSFARSSTLGIQPLSVAEISARLRLHLGVAKILVGDLKAAGHPRHPPGGCLRVPKTPTRSCE